MNERTVVFHLPTMVAGSLAAISGTVAGRTYPLTAGTFVIGRQAELDLSLPTEPGVSKIHAKIVAEGDHYVIHDAESRNGTVVNGSPVQRVRLYDGDEIQICGCTLRFTQTAGGGVQVKNPPSVDDRVMVGNLPTRGISESALARRDTGAMAMDISLSGTGSATGAPLSPSNTEAFPPRHVSSSMEPTYVSPPPQQVGRRSPAPYFIIGMLTSMLGGGGVYAMYLMNDDGGARVAATDPTTVPASGLGGVPTSAEPVAPATDPASPTDVVATPPGAESATPPAVDGAAEAADPAAPAAGESETLPSSDLPTEAPEPVKPVDDEPTTDPVVDEPSAPEPVATRPKAAKKPTRTKPVEKPVGEVEPDVEEAPVATTTDTATAASDASTATPAGAAVATVAAAPASTSVGGWVPAQMVPAQKAPVRVSSGGRVRSVDAVDGDLVVEGDTLVTFDQAVDAADIATLKESIRALEAVVESGGSSEAEVMLRQEQERLSRLEAGAQQGRVSAPASGTLVGFTPKAGEKLRARQVIGNVVGANSRAITATVEKADGAKLKRGSKVRVRSASRGELDGTVTSTKKKGAKFMITIEVASGDASDVDAVRIP